jgi:hypothetical protein
VQWVGARALVVDNADDADADIVAVAVRQLLVGQYC